MAYIDIASNLQAESLLVSKVNSGPLVGINTYQSLGSTTWDYGGFGSRATTGYKLAGEAELLSQPITVRDLVLALAAEADLEGQTLLVRQVLLALTGEADLVVTALLVRNVVGALSGDSDLTTTASAIRDLVLDLHSEAWFRYINIPEKLRYTEEAVVRFYTVEELLDLLRVEEDLRFNILEEEI